MTKKELGNDFRIIEMLYGFNKEYNRYPCFTELFEEAEKQKQNLTKIEISKNLDKMEDLDILRQAEQKDYIKVKGRWQSQIRLMPEGIDLYHSHIEGR